MIFISYRRSDGKATAQLIQKSLLERGFSKQDIFLDLHDVLAEDFVERTNDAISNCDYFVLLISKDSFIKRDRHDYYWDEIHQALDENKKIIPVLYEVGFDERTIPDEFKKKKLHLKNAIRYDVEYENDSLQKIIKALTKDSHPSIINRIASLFIVPTLFITIYLGVSLIGAVIRYVWDNYWLSDETCEYIASSRIQRGEDDIFYYITHDSIYVYDKYRDSVWFCNNAYLGSNDGFPVIINKSGMTEAGFWTLAVGMVYEISKFHFKPHGNSKVIGVVIAVTVSIIAGFGFGFVCERMLFPVHESRIIRKKLHSPVWWNRMTNSTKLPPSINKKF